jgi:ATP synthase protein I
VLKANKQNFYAKQACAILGMQAALLMLMGLAAWTFFNKTIAYSVFCGGMIALIANLCFALQLFAPQGASRAKAIVHASYKGEATKWFITASLFYLLLRYITSVNLESTLLAYCAMQGVGWLLVCAIMPFLKRKVS